MDTTYLLKRRDKRHRNIQASNTLQETTTNTKSDLK